MLFQAILNWFLLTKQKNKVSLSFFTYCLQYNFTYFHVSKSLKIELSGHGGLVIKKD